MTEFFKWLYQLNGTNPQNQTLLVQSLSVNSLFMAYAVIALITKEVAYLAAFFICCTFVSISYFNDYQVYLADLIVYSYVYFYTPKYKTKFACVIIMLIDLGMVTDAVLYATTKTYLYSNIESIALLSHLFFIYTTIPIDKIRHGLASFFDSVRSISSVDYFFIVFRYNVQQIHSLISKKCQT
jgi:uncharacterized membrane protein